jgi:hypothetical protein
MEISPTEQKALVGQLVVVRAGTKFRDAKFETLCRVVRETGKRCYVEIVETDTTYSSTYGVHGYKDTGQYVNKSDIVVEDANSELFRKLVSHEQEHKKWMMSLGTQEEDELRPVRRRFADRRTQKFAQFDDEVREMVKAEHK